MEVAYLTGGVLFLVVWIALFFLRKDLRRMMLLMSLVIAPLGPLSEFFYRRDYWRPELLFGVRIGFEDLLFTFCIGGITAVIYEEIFGKHFAKKYLPNHRMAMLSLAVFGVIWMVVGNLMLRFNSIYVSTSGFLVIAVVILISRHDLLKVAFFSGLLTGALMFLFYLLFFVLFPNARAWWLLGNLSGILIFGVPLEELMWGFGWGMIAGPAYEYFSGRALK